MSLKMSSVDETPRPKQAGDLTHRHRVEKSSRQQDDMKNPCIKEQKMSFQCLDDNAYDRDKCSKEFLNYKHCREFWRLVTMDRKKKGIEPYLPLPENRKQALQDYKHIMPWKWHLTALVVHNSYFVWISCELWLVEPIIDTSECNGNQSCTSMFARETVRSFVSVHLWRIDFKWWQDILLLIIENELRCMWMALWLACSFKCSILKISQDLSAFGGRRPISPLSAHIGSSYKLTQNSKIHLTRPGFEPTTAKWQETSDRILIYEAMHENRR